MEIYTNIIRRILFWHMQTQFNDLYEVHLQVHATYCQRNMAHKISDKRTEMRRCTNFLLMISDNKESIMLTQNICISC
jgi:hypothetical protein